LGRLGGFGGGAVAGFDALEVSERAVIGEAGGVDTALETVGELVGAQGGLRGAKSGSGW